MGLNTFIILANLLNQKDHVILCDFIMLMIDKVEFHYKVLNLLLMQKVPDFHKKIMDIKHDLNQGFIESFTFVQSWWSTLYSLVFPIDMTVKLWDEILKHGDFQ